MRRRRRRPLKVAVMFVSSSSSLRRMAESRVAWRRRARRRREHICVMCDICDTRDIFSLVWDEMSVQFFPIWKIARSLHYFLSLSLSLVRARAFQSACCRSYKNASSNSLFFARGLFVLRRPLLKVHIIISESHRSLCVWSREREEDIAFSILWTLGPPPPIVEEEEEEKEEKKKTRVRRLVPEEEMPLSDTKEDIIVIIIIIIIIINERTRSRALGSPMRSRSSRSTRIR